MRPEPVVCGGLTALSLVVLWALATPAWADGPPLLVRGELKSSDPLDRVQKQSRARVHEIELKQGEAILAELRSIDFDPLLRVEDEQGNILAKNDDLGPGDLNSRLGFVAPRAGTYRLVVTSPAPGRLGEFRLEVVVLQPVGAPVIMRGELTGQSREAQGRRYELHPLQPQRDCWYLLELTSSDFDPLLVLRDSLGKLLVQDADGGTGRAARLVWPSGVAGRWTVQVQGAQGRYALQIRAYRGVLQAEPTEREQLAQQARAVNTRGVEQYQAGKYADATALLRQALELRQRLYPATQYPHGHADLAASLNNLAQVLREAGQHERARGYFEQAVAMYEKLYAVTQYPQGHPDLATSVNSLGSLHFAAGQLESARRYLEQALAMRQKLYPAARYPHGHPDLARSLNNLGALHQEAGQLALARRCLEQALAMRQKLYPPSQYAQGHPELIRNLNNLGFVLQTAGDYRPARRCFEEALAMARALYPAAQYPQGHPLLAACLDNLGRLLQRSGQNEPARAYHEQALAMRQSLYPAALYPQGHSDLVQSLNSLGLLLQNARQYGPARAYFEQMLAMNRKLYPAAQYSQGHAEVALSLHNLGELLCDAGEFEPARGYLEQALAMYEQLYPAAQYPQGHPLLAVSLSNLGFLFREAGQLMQARACFEKALAMNVKLYPVAQYPQGHPHLASNLHNLGALLQAQGRPEPAHGYLKQAMPMVQTLAARNTMLVPEAQALDLLRSLPRTRDLYLAAAVKTGPAPQAVYAEVWPSRGLLTRLLQRRHQATRALQHEDPQIREAWHELTAARADLARLLSTPATDAARHEQDKTRLSGRKEALEQVLANLLPELDRARELDRLGPRDLAGLLPAGHVFVDVWRYYHFDQGGTSSERYVAFVVAAGRDVRLVELHEAGPIDRAVHAWRAKINRFEDGAADAQAVAAQVWAPLARVLPAATRVVYLAADGELTRLPWAALPGSQAGTVLLEELTLAVVPHGPFLLEQLKYPPAARPGPERVLALGNVAYGPADAPIYSALPGTAAELRKVQEAAGSRPVTVLQHGEARWERLQAGLAQARYAHLATHGYYDQAALALERRRLEAQWKAVTFDVTETRTGQAARSPLAFTGLAMAGANQPSGELASIVTGEALVELPLENLRLCVLSACESGLGDLGPLTGEAVQGLPHALHLAGCPNIISSLWNVNDQATAALMAKFYDGLWREGKPPLEALRQAQLFVYRHPELVVDVVERGPTALKTLQAPPAASGRTAATKLWAGFVLSGAGR